MKGLEANNLCSHGGDILAYLYGEMAASDRYAFEVHLSECGACIDDFAELSQSRYPVYEWKHTQFDPMPTPRVIVPFNETAAVSWFDKIRTAFSFRPTAAFGAVGAAILVTVVTGYFILGTTSRNVEVAQEVELSGSPERRAVVIPSPSVIANAPAQVQANDENEVREAAPKVMKASTAAKPTVRSPQSKPPQQPKRNDPIPVMSSIEDDEDDSLRLVDIFEEIGTSE